MQIMVILFMWLLTLILSLVSYKHMNTLMNTNEKIFESNLSIVIWKVPVILCNIPNEGTQSLYRTDSCKTKQQKDVSHTNKH